MKEKSTETGIESRPVWEGLEALARQGVQRLLQQLLEEEAEEVLGRRRYERRDGVDDHGPPAPRPRPGGAIRESVVAAVPAAHRGSRPAAARSVPARAGPRGLRAGPAGVAGGGRAAVGPVDRAAEGGLAGRVRSVEAPAAGRDSSPSTCGRTGFTSRRDWRRTRRPCSS
jgi:hypothetical protein